jgi:hypothetical protein
MTITSEDDIKRLVKQNITPTDLTSAVAAGDKEIVALTNRDVEEWSETDNAYGRLQQIGALYGSWSILISWDPAMYLEKAREMWKAYLYSVEQFRTMHLPEDRTNPDIVISESEYTTYKLNPDYEPFLSSY